MENGEETDASFSSHNLRSIPMTDLARDQGNHCTMFWKSSSKEGVLFGLCGL